MITEKSISFVVQGQITNLTKKTIDSIRLYFPNSTIILSTWKNNKIDDLDYDSVILSDDPGGVEAKVSGGSVNTLRQIISTSEGLKKCNTEYVAKIRSDMIFYGNNLPLYYERYKTLRETVKYSLPGY